MNNQLQQKIAEYRQLNTKISNFQESVKLMNWDLQTGAPKEAMRVRSEVISSISAEIFKISTSSEMINILSELSKSENLKQLDFIVKRSVEEDSKNYRRLKNISSEKYKEYVNIKTQAQSVWKKAKFEKDFSQLKPYLKKIVEYKRKMVKELAYDGHPYDILLDEYEPGMSVEKLDKIFSPLKENLIGLLENVRNTGYKPNNSIFAEELDVVKQQKLILKLLNDIGFSMNKGRIDQSIHPFTSKMNSGDIRITINKFKPDKFRGALFATLHEGGHGLYDQNIGKKLENTPLFQGTSYGIHESQSRFWENMIGKSLDFWYYFREELSNEFPHQMKDVSIEEIYHAVNKVNNSIIRTSSDEITYNLHIILRYELEKALITGEIDVDNLPKAWSEKTQKYLGLIPKDDGEGILQDIHWAKGSFGYFPTYALGNIYAAQLMDKLRKDIPDIQLKIRKGSFFQITNWLVENVHAYGKLVSPEELIKEITGEEANIKSFNDYLINKYSEIYGLK